MIHFNELSAECWQIVLGIQQLAGIAHADSKRSRFWSNAANKNIPTKLCLIHSEISEAMEGYRKNLMDDKLTHRSAIEVELADAVIRIADLSAYLNLDLAGAIVDKMAYNRNRADHKPEARASTNGKKF
jgi:NTP pyrophosphatase (non-canonical NTP hydrolase)